MSALFSQQRAITKKLRHPSRGAGMIEFVFSITIVIFLLFWLFEFCMLMYTYTVMAQAAKEAVRYAIVHGASNSAPSGPSTGSTSNCTTNIASVQSVVDTYAAASLHDTTGLTKTVCYLDGNNAVNNRVQVSVSYPYIPYINLPWTSPTIRASAEGRIVY